MPSFCCFTVPGQWKKSRRKSGSPIVSIFQKRSSSFSSSRLANTGKHVFIRLCRRKKYSLEAKNNRQKNRKINPQCRMPSFLRDRVRILPDRYWHSDDLSMADAILVQQRPVSPGAQEGPLLNSKRRLKFRKRRGFESRTQDTLGPLHGEQTIRLQSSVFTSPVCQSVI